MAEKMLHEPDETVEFFYGINSRTFDIELVSLTGGGRLHRMGKGHSCMHHLASGRTAEAEIEILWGLLDIFSFPAAMGESEQVKQQLDALRRKAIARRREVEKGAGRPTTQVTEIRSLSNPSSSRDWFLSGSSGAIWLP